MLKAIKLTCFRQHEDRTFTFSEGLNAVRGANEAGKTTILEAWMYAFFGSRALRDPFEDVVTWGHKPADLKVEINYGDYDVVRGKNGAEVRSMGQVLVTGQNEVSKFCEGLVGCDANTAMNLMFANQTGLRGILTSGPKATATLIEDLGEFDLFDRILDAAQHKLSLGSSAVQEDRVRNLIAQRGALVAPSRPDAEAHAKALNQIDGEVATLKSRREAQQKEFDAWNEKYQAELGRQIDRDNALAEQRRLQSQLNGLQDEAAAIDVAGEMQDTAPLETQIREAGEHEQVRTAYAQFQKMPEAGARMPAPQWLKQNAALDGEIADAKQEIQRLETLLKVTEAQLVTSSVCGFCGQDVSQFPEAAAKNAALMGQLREAGAQLKAQQTTLAEKQTAHDALTTMANDCQRIERAVRGIERWLERDDSTIPVRFSWRGEPPAADAVNVEALKRELAAVKERNQTLIRARAKKETLTEQAGRLKTQLGALMIPEAMAQAEMLEMAGKVSTLSSGVVAMDAQLAALAQQRADAEASYRELVRGWEQYEAAVAGLTERIAEAEREIAALQFNNALVKKVRAARPVVGNKLWTMVLTSVSTIFSQMRGEKSVVTKGEGGFLVNGKASALSGSTLDLLGLAVRCALVKTFIPSCNFLVLDEPSSACDQDRTNAMLGYIAASGFRQVLMVTHNDASESFADHLIQL